ncbi:hypothetical protein B7486_75005, partial [cyanobacterium TDX16]
MSHRWSRRAASTVALVGLLLGSGLAACSSDEDGASDDSTPGREGGDPSGEPQWPDSSPAIGPLVSGTEGVVDGTWYWTDYAYD